MKSTVTTLLTFAVFEAWANQLNTRPSPEMVRRKFGCSKSTAAKYLARTAEEGAELPKGARVRSCMDAVFSHLGTLDAPATCGQVAAALALEPDAAMHALQNLFEAGRLERNSRAKPYTYALPILNRLALLPAVNDSGTPRPLHGHVVGRVVVM